MNLKAAYGDQSAWRVWWTILISMSHAEWDCFALFHTHAKANMRYLLQPDWSLLF